MLNATTSFFTNLMNKYLADSFTIAILLTFLAGLLAMTIEGTGFMETTEYWGSGFWDLLAFTMQMVVILAAGYVLAKTPVVDRTLNRMVAKVNRPRTAIIVATLAGGIGSLLNWGFGLVVGGIVAGKLARQVKGVHYPLIIAAGYSGFSLYGLGLSGTVPVLISTSGHFLEESIGLVPLSETIFSLPMLLTTLTVLVTLPLFNSLLHPKKKEDIIEINKELHVEETISLEPGEDEKGTLASKLNHSKIVGYVIGVLGLLYIIMHFVNGGSIDLNIVNFALIFLGILLLGAPIYYVKILHEGVKTVSGIILQYPFYAGIMGILVGSGLVVTFSGWFVSFSSAANLPFWSMVSAYFINILAPSGGGQWAIQGPIMVEAAKTIGSSIQQTSMAVMVGDAWNNMVQPFWILPVLALSGLKLKDVMGYMVLIMFWLGIVFSSAFLLWGYFG
ncbi:short-chain fatty acid transporter [Planococcus salinus]|uniref:Short-chain fatty acid transporter n=1 Tax=Planococcus salinus TaxID=1848460 RepID=A0A3M8P7Y3_9BACL|nr:TIGR00366 family protein [Planococcus salinus]RNF39809.1 short-chain fatty acid transporter [Planococcus salinus]